MGLTHVDMKVMGSNRRKSATVRLLVDSGAAFSVVPGEILKDLGIKPDNVERFELANGEVVERRIGSAWFEFEGRRGAGPVVFGEPGDANLLGVVTLECLGLAFDPLRREIKPLRLLMVRLAPVKCFTQHSLLMAHCFHGATPVLISNTVVKPHSADGTARANCAGE